MRRLTLERKQRQELNNEIQSKTEQRKAELLRLESELIEREERVKQMEKKLKLGEAINRRLEQTKARMRHQGSYSHISQVDNISSSEPINISTIAAPNTVKKPALNLDDSHQKQISLNYPDSPIIS